MAAQGTAEIVLIYFAGTFGMIVLAGAIFFFFITYQKRMLRKELEINRIKAEQQEEILRNAILAQEKERKRISQDLHDEVGAMLSVVKLNISRFERKAENASSKELAVETKAYLDDVITQVRRISRALMPPSLEKLGLDFAISELVNWVNKTGQLKIDYWKNGTPVRFNPKKELAVFRIVQELLNNAIKHARASVITIKTRYSSGGIAVSVCDNGVGFDLEQMTRTGLGLRNLESRTQILGARIKMKSKPGKGTSAVMFIYSLS
ncbi:Histidine kinase-, DNA gyrase B-, and HSP90-like ATPase [Mariniphaga anaerophila]|uniref:histidine kinase n=1 Tax=Mariniphaga anaerophila TaxID=1484053 RepID=A0A1M5A4C2_9BACT|nr:sensor histidine kinase [Mariniphaga anaerophila]SHF24796.1 Histidine kinase-, DNA gyrase B-, and HSP90-like ATPase [Mariniphaga anaerophila]